MKKISAEQLYDILVNQEKILETRGQISFYLGDVNIVVRQKDVVGNIMQEWLVGWFEKRGYAYTRNPNSQMPPDIYLEPDNKESDLLEVKAFNYEASPGFDIADFNAYQRQVIKEPYMLHEKFIIFGYKMGDDGYVRICNVWLKNVWEICRPMANWALNLQVKKNVVHKIRPAKWYGRASRFRTFERLEDYLSAIEECVYKNPETHNNAANWKRDIEESYRKYYKKDLQIPRWNDICDKYIL